MGIDGIVWEEPPQVDHPARPNMRLYERQLAPLVNHPKRWALIATKETDRGAGGMATNLRRRTLIIPHPDHEWEFVSRGVKVYARYMGPPG